MPVVRLNEFLSNKNILHSDASNYTDALMFLIRNKDVADVVIYETKRQFSVSNIGMLEMDSNNHYYYEFSVNREGDIVNDIKLESKFKNDLQMTFNIGGIDYKQHEITEFVACCAMYNDFRIRITFSKLPQPNDTFTIIFKNYILKVEDRLALIHSKVITKKCIFSNGVCLKNNMYSKGIYEDDETRNLE